MIANYIKIILRQIGRQRLFAFINIAGLSIGLTGALLILLYVRYETSYDRFHPQAERICRVTRQYDTPTGYQRHFARVPDNWINQLPDEFAEIETLIRFQEIDSPALRIGNQLFRDRHTYLSDANVFDVFHFPLLHGNPATALTEPYSIVISESMAKKYFGNTNPLGREIERINRPGDSPIVYRVSGVMRDLPPNAHFDIHFLVSFRAPAERRGWAYVYLLLRPGTDLRILEDKLPEFIAKYGGERDAQYSSLHLQKLTDIHLRSQLDRELAVNGDIHYIYLFGIIGLLILLIAAFNFMNLATARSALRAREIGIRKVLGSERRQLIGYFLCESVMFALIAFFLSILLTELLLPYFNNFTGNPTPTNILQNYTALSLFFLISVLTGLLAGSYPALFLSGFRPVEILAAQTAGTPAAGRRFQLRQLLVILQFTISIALISCTIITAQQFRFLRNRKLGFNAEQVLALRELTPRFNAKYEAFRHELLDKSFITDVTGVMDEPSKQVLDGGFVTVAGIIEDPENAPALYLLPCYQNFPEFMELEFVAGRDFGPEAVSHETQYGFNSLEEHQEYIHSAPRSYLLNEKAVETLGFDSPEAALGNMLDWRNASFQLQRGPIVGVVRDFHYSTMKYEIKPMILVREPFWVFTFLVRIDSRNAPAAIRQVESSWHKFYPDQPFEYAFLDELFADLYRAEAQQGQLMLIFTLLAIAIACLGLFGLVTFNIERRTKEIGVRKVMGASISHISLLLIGQNSRWILLAVVLATPFSWYFMQKWLQNFAYRVDFGIWPFLWAGLTVLGIALITIGWQAIRAATVNPVKSLRYE